MLWPGSIKSFEKDYKYLIVKFSGLQQEQQQQQQQVFPTVKLLNSAVSGH